VILAIFVLLIAFALLSPLVIFVIPVFLVLALCSSPQVGLFVHLHTHSLIILSRHLVISMFSIQNRPGQFDLNRKRRKIVWNVRYDEKMIFLFSHFKEYLGHAAMEATDHWIPEADVKLPVVLKVRTSSAPSCSSQPRFIKQTTMKINK
jgi:hypothetical protein